MTIRLLWVILMSSTVCTAFTQINLTEPRPVRKKVDRCATVPYLAMLKKQNPQAGSDAQFEQWMQQQIEERRLTIGLQDILPYEVAVIFHVIHDGEAEGTGTNISQDRIRSQLAQLNKDFANLSNSPYASARTTGIKFCLAEKDPLGNTLIQPGIRRINRNTFAGATAPYSIAQFNDFVKPSSIYNPAKYINIWIAPLSDPTLGDVAGFATFPTGSGLPGLFSGETNSNAGVVIIPSTVGSYTNPNGNCGGDPYITGKTLAHEMGHFLGLRHIWGDTDCGNDFCNDTPIHEKENLGAFTHPKPNTCGTPDEMFENYMDYTNDDQLNTFTLNQVERIQVVMQNSPRRAGLQNTDVGKVCFSSNKISFAPCVGSLIVSETGTSGSCPRIRQIKLLLNIEDRASGPATVNIITAGSATAGIDYILETPTLNFAAGDGFKEVIISIIDDGIPESNESIGLSYTISGAGVTAGTTTQTFVVVVVDDDQANINQNLVTLMNENFDGALTGWGSLASQNAKNVFTVGTGATGFTGRSAYVTNNAELGQDAPNMYDVSIGGATILRSPALSTVGLKNLKLSLKWKCVGETFVDYGEPIVLTTANPTSPIFFPNGPIFQDQATVKAENYTFPANYSNLNLHFGVWWENDDADGNQPPVAIDEILITGEGTKVETQLSSIRANQVPAQLTVHFLSNQDQEIIASVANTNAPIACLNATVLSAGNGQVPIQTDMGTYQRSAKVLGLTPAQTYNGPASITLYFTQTEISVWGGAISQLKVMQVNDGVNLAGGVNFSNAKILTPTVNDQLAARGYISYTVQATGFSQFFLVSPDAALPLQFTDFKVQPQGSKLTLNWNTANEYSNKGFDVERSPDATQFSSIAFVPGKGFTVTPGQFNYTLNDAAVKPGVTYFYRLRQVDLDGRSSYSPIRSGKIDGSNGFAVFPNPAKNQVRLIPGQGIVAAVDLINMKGQIIKSWSKQVIPDAGIMLQLGNLPAGIYSLRVLDGLEIRHQKLVIE